MRALNLVVAVSVASLFATAAAQTNAVTFKDQDFKTADWELVVIAVGGDDNTPKVSQYTFGGNPGAFRVIEITASGGSQARPAVVATFHRKVGAVYDPAQNTILSIDYSEDDKVVESTPGGQGQSMGPALQQSDDQGKVHYYAVQSYYTGAPGAWVTKKLTGLLAGDFVEITSSATRGVVNVGSHPNFKKGAKPIQLGFWRAVQDTGGSGGGHCGSSSGGGTATSEGIDNWSITLNVGSADTPVCTVDPRNTFLPLHLPIFHTLFSSKVEEHRLTVAVTAGSTPVSGIDITLTSSKGAFPTADGALASTMKGKTDAKGVALFVLNPPPPTGFDRTDFEAKGTVGMTEVKCAGSVTGGIGALSEMLQSATDSALPAAMALAEKYSGELALNRDFSLSDIPEVPLSDRGRLLLERALVRHGNLIQRALESRTVKLNRRERKDIEELLRQFDSEDSPYIRHAADVLRKHMKSGTVTVAEVRNPPVPRTPANLEQRRKAMTKAGVQTAYASLPLNFEPNVGQIGGSSRFMARGKGYRLYLTPKEAVFLDDAVPFWAMSAAAQVGMEVVGGNAHAKIAGADPLPGRSNYLIGNDPQRWHTDVPHYGKVRYEQVYPGVDLVLYAHGQNVQFDFVVAPGSRPERILLAFRGADKLALDSKGNLIVEHVGGKLQLGPPFVYQEIDGIRKATDGKYVLKGGNRVGFEIARYAADKPLVIDPVLSYSSYLGGDKDETASGIAVDAEGNAYITGVTTSTTFPTVNPLQAWPTTTKPFASHIFLAKLNPAGTGLVYSTFIGGDGSDGAVGVAVDAEGNAYLTGSTTSKDFPMVQPIQGTLKGGGILGGDGFVLKLNPAGSALVYSSFLGGNDFDNPKGLAIDPAGNLYVTGTTSSADFPMKNAYQPTKKGGTLPFDSDAFVTKINPAGNDFVYSTYLGGKGNEFGYAVTVDVEGNAYVTGSTDSTDFPLVNAIQNTNKHGQDVYVAKLSAAGSALLFSTYLGGESDDAGLAIALDGGQNVYVTGITGSRTFPLKDAIQNKLGEKNELGGDAFLAKIAANGSALVYSTFIGGTGTETGIALAVGKDGSAYVVGQTDSTDFPVLGDPFQPASAGKNDGFVVKVNPAGSAFSWATYIGGGGQDSATGIALDASGAVYIAGSTTSIDFPVTPGAFQTVNHGKTEALASKIVEGVPIPRMAIVSTASLKAQAAPESLVSGTGAGLATKTERAGAAPLPTTLADRTVTVKDSLSTERQAALSLVSPKQIHFEIPAGTATGLAGVTVFNGSAAVATGTILIDSVAPALFSADASGAGVALGTAVQVAGDGTETPSAVYRCDASGTKCTAIAVDLGDGSIPTYLHLMATGIRGRSSLDGVSMIISPVTVPVVTAEPLGDGSGTDQVKVGPLPMELKGIGSANLALTVDGRAANVVTVTFGVPSANVPVIELSPASLDFGPVTVGQGKESKVAVHNRGTAALHVSSAVAVSPISSSMPFVVTAPTGAFTVEAGRQVDVTVRFTPAAAATYTGELIVASDDPVSPSATVALVGMGQAGQVGPAAIDVSPKSLDFGALLQGTTKELTFAISGASGQGPLTVTAIAINNAKFTLVNPPTLPASMTFAPLSVTVRYTPTTVGSDTGTLTINSNAASTPVLTIPLAGSAYPAGPVELKVDDGTFERPFGFSLGAPNANYINRLTPPGYPATLNSIRIYFNDNDGAVNPSTSINVLYAANPSGGTNIDTLRLAGFTGAVTSTGRWLEYPLKTPLKIDAGDFVVGFSMANGVGIYPVAGDTASASQGRSYTSPDGVKFTNVVGNIAIRAQVVVGP